MQCTSLHGIHKTCAESVHSHQDEQHQGTRKGSEVAWCHCGHSDSGWLLCYNLDSEFMPEDYRAMRKYKNREGGDIWRNMCHRDRGIYWHSAGVNLWDPLDQVGKEGWTFHPNLHPLSVSPNVADQWKQPQRTGRVGRTAQLVECPTEKLTLMMLTHVQQLGMMQQGIFPPVNFQCRLLYRACTAPVCNSNLACINICAIAI